MTMMMTDSQFGLEDMEALLWAPSSPMADAACSPFSDAEEPQEGGRASLQGDALPASPLTSSSPLPFYSPPPSPPVVLLHGDKARMEADLLSPSWLDHPGQLTCSQILSGDDKEDPLRDLDWMAERMDLGELDLDSLIGSCSDPADEHQNSPEDLLASLDCPMELDSHQLPLLSSPHAPSAPVICSSAAITVDEPDSCSEGQEVPSSPLSVPEPQDKLEIKSEPGSPAAASPSFPAFTLDLGSEVDVSESEVKPLLVPEAPRIVLSLSPTRIVLVLAPRNDHSIATTTEVIHGSPSASPSQRSTRSRPYPEPKVRVRPPSPSGTEVKSLGTEGEAQRMKMPKDKKQKKMEQNKTAATRYRQKKRAEQDALITERTLLERRNLELIEKAESMTREIQYLKELMEEVRMARLRKGLSADP